MMSVLAYLLKKFYILCAIVVIGLAVLVQAGRSLFPLLEHYDQALTDWFSEQLALDVSVERLSAEWEELTPALTFHQLRIDDQDGVRLLRAEQVLVRLNLVSSVMEGRLAWDKVELRQPRLSLSQGEDGYWGLPDFATDDPDDQPLAPDDLLTLFQLGARVELLEARIDLRFAGGHQQEFVAPYVLLEHQDDFHRLSLQVDLQERDRAMVAVLEGRGDPRSPETFETRGYLQLRDFPTLEPLTAIGGILFGESGHREWYREGRMNAGLWFSSQEDGGGYDWAGRVSMNDVALPVESLTLDQLSTELSGEWRRSGEWHVNLTELNADWRDRRLESLQLALSSEGPKADTQLLLDRLDLEYWAALGDQLGLFGGDRLREVIRTLNPRGTLHHLQLALPPDDAGNWQLRAELSQVSVAPWQGVPGLSGVSGYVEADRDGGHLDLDSRDGFSMHYAGAYREPMEYRSARGQVAWYLRPDDNRVYVNSGPLTLRGAGEQATGSMWLSLPWQRNTGDIDLYLDIHGRQLNADVYQKYLPRAVPDNLKDWLARSLGEDNPGRAADAHFLFRGTLNRPDRPHMKSYQLALEMAGANLAYHPDWPALSDLSGQLLIDDNRVDARIDRAHLYQSELERARIRVDESDAGKGLLLRIDGQLQVLASDALELLREGYLRRYIDGQMNDWRMRGVVDTDLSLAIPLQEGQPGAHQRIDMALNLSQLSLGELGLSVDDLEGSLRYETGEGLSGDNLTGSLFGSPLTLSLASDEENGVPITRVNVSGRTSGDDLADWTGRPVFRFLEGEFDFDSQLSLSHHPEPEPDRDQRLATFTLETDLDGVELDWPAPLGKPASESRSLAINLVVGRQTALVETRYGERLHAVAQAERENGRMNMERLALGLDRDVSLPEAPGLLLQGYLGRLNHEAWAAVWERYQRLAENKAGEARDEAENLLSQLPVRAELELGSQRLGPLNLDDLSLELASQDQGWRVDFANDRLKGRLDWQPEEPLALALEHLDLSSSALERARERAATDDDAPPLDLKTLLRADVTIEQLRLDGEDLGHWQFALRPDERGLTLDGLTGEIRGLAVDGEAGEGGRVRWDQGRDEAPERTSVELRLSAGDLSEVMRRWDQSDVLESESAEYDVAISWPGAPQAFALEQVEGDVSFEVLAGRFKRNPASGSEGILRLFAVLNFDSLARRLRLDFSDLYQSGLAYDSIRGRMSFRRGELVFSEPVQVRSPSSRLQLGGRANLIDETLDARLVASLPVAGNLTFLTAVAAGLPAAAGVFLVSKLFEKQVDQATSISYTIRGDWDDPTIKFDRMFEGEAGLSTDEDPSDPDLNEEP